MPAELKSIIRGGKFVDLKHLQAKSFMNKAEDGQFLFYLDKQGRLVPKMNSKVKADLTIDQWSVRIPRTDEHRGMLPYAELIRGAAMEHPSRMWPLYDEQCRSRREADSSGPSRDDW